MMGDVRTKTQKELALLVFYGSAWAAQELQDRHERSVRTMDLAGALHMTGLKYAQPSAHLQTS